MRARIAIDAQLEAELAAMDAEERPAFMEEFGIESPAAARFVHEVYQAVGLRSFFTVGEDEVRAWTIRAGDSAIEAAGKIHTDLAKGFVRAEVYSYDDLVAAGSEKALKAAGGDPARRPRTTSSRTATSSTSGAGSSLDDSRTLR